LPNVKVPQRSVALPRHWTKPCRPDDPLDGAASLKVEVQVGCPGGAETGHDRVVCLVDLEVREVSGVGRQRGHPGHQVVQCVEADDIPRRFTIFGALMGVDG